MLSKLLEVDEEHMPWLEVGANLLILILPSGPPPHCDETDPCCLWVQEGGNLPGTLLHSVCGRPGSTSAVWAKGMPVDC